MPVLSHLRVFSISKYIFTRVLDLCTNFTKNCLVWCTYHRLSPLPQIRPIQSLRQLRCQAGTNRLRLSDCPLFLTSQKVQFTGIRFRHVTSNGDVHTPTEIWTRRRINGGSRAFGAEFVLLEVIIRGFRFVVVARRVVQFERVQWVHFDGFWDPAEMLVRFGERGRWRNAEGVVVGGWTWWGLVERQRRLFGRNWRCFWFGSQSACIARTWLGGRYWRLKEI